MFGFGNRNTGRSVNRGGAWSGGGLRRAAVAGLGMLAYRWWRNRQASNARPAGSWAGQGQGSTVGNQGTGTGQPW
jgi:hypothetical protein